MTRNFEAPGYIFLAEDNPADVYLIRQALVENHVDVHLEVATDGKEALLSLDRQGTSAHPLLPSAIVLDLNLPKHDGMEILKRLRRDRKFALIPVVVLTSSDSPQDRINAAQLGAAEYLQKPSSLEGFMALGGVIKKMLSNESKWHAQLEA
jgi:CheY-like chemotaxis protein